MVMHTIPVTVARPENGLERSKAARDPGGELQETRAVREAAARGNGRRAAMKESAAKRLLRIAAIEGLELDTEFANEPHRTR